MALPLDPLQNRLLAAMPAEDLRRWLPFLVPVDLARGEVLHESGAIPRQAWFPTDVTISLLYLSDNGACDEIGVIGREGMVGTSLCMDGQSTPARAQVQAAGGALVLPARVLQDDFERFSAVRHVLLRYALALGAQISQTAVCNRHHCVEQRLARRLLQGLDCQPGTVRMTQEQLAGLLGVRRESVTAAALRLQGAGLLHYSRGQIGVLDRAGLERHACKCHAMIQQEYVRLLPATAEAATGRGSRAALPPWMTSMACTHAARTWPASSVRQRTD